MTRRLLTIFGVVLLGVLLVWHLDWDSFLAALGSPRARAWLPVLGLLMAAEAILDGAALRAAFGDRAPLMAVVGANQLGSLANRIVPLDAGEVLKMRLLRGLVGADDAITGTLVWNVQFKLTRPVLVASLAGLAWLVGGPWQAGASWVLLATGLALLPYVGLVVLLRLPVAAAVIRWLGRLGVVAHPDETLTRAVGIQAHTRDFASLHPGGLHLLRLYQTLARGLSLVIWAAALHALGLDYPWWVVVMAWAAVNVMSYVSSLVPTRVGTVEASAFGAFALLGLDAGIGLQAQVLLTVLGLIVAVLLGQFAPRSGAQKPGRTVPDLPVGSGKAA